MDPDPKPLIEVSIYVPEMAPQPGRPSRGSGQDWSLPMPHRGMLGSVGCGLLVVALHLLLVMPLLPGVGHVRRTVSSTASLSGAESDATALQVTVIEASPLEMQAPPPTTAPLLQPVPEWLLES